MLKDIKHRLSSPFIRNVGWMGGAELANRVFRLGTTVTLARLLTPEQYGLIAIVLATQEFSKVFTLSSGIGSKLIQANERDIEVLSKTSYWLNWIICISLFFIQCLIAFPVAWTYQNNQIILPICVLAVSYLILPTFAVQSALIQRENRLSIIAFCNAAQSLVANILTIVLALLGFGIWSVVLPNVISNIVWTVITYHQHKWRPSGGFQIDRWNEVVKFSTDILGVELTNKLKGNIDYLIVGYFWGVEELGLYYFSFNAGIGISLNVINAFSSAMFPYFCAARENLSVLRERYFRSVKATSSIVTPIILLQVALAPLYVPFIFGDKWVDAIPVLMLICLSALPLPLSTSAYHLLNSVGETRVTLGFTIISTIVFTFMLLLVVHLSILWTAVAVLAFQMLVQPLYSIWAIRKVFVLAR